MAGKKRSVRGGKQSQAVAGLWTYAEAARFLGIGEKTLMAWVERGLEDLPVIRLGRLVRFRQESLIRWLDSRETNSATAAHLQGAKRRPR